MEWDESPVETAARELEEETGLSATIGPALGVFSRWYAAHESVRGEAGHVVGILDEATAWLDTFRRSYPGLFDRLVWHRNRMWVRRITDTLAARRSALVLVGAGHLVGDVGIPALLVAEGLNVSRVDE